MMGDMVRRLAIFAVFASLFSYVVLFIGGSFVQANAASERAPIIILDTVGVASHKLSGSLLLPSICDYLSVYVKDISTTTYQLAFITWQDPSIRCVPTSVARSFEAIAFATSTGITFQATLDGQNIPILVGSDRPIRSPQ